MKSPIFEQSQPVNYLWKELKLAQSFQGDKALDLSDLYSLEEGLAYFSENLNFIERLKVLREVQAQGKDLDFGKYFHILGQHYDENLHKRIIDSLGQWPKEFVNWAEKKDLNPKDFRGFLNEDHVDFFSILKKVAQLEPSKSKGLKIIDWSLDLLAQDKMSIEEFQSYKNEHFLFKFLQQKRFSESLKMDSALKGRVEKIEWSKDTKVSVNREGDKNQIILEVKASQPEDLAYKLERVLSKMEALKRNWYDEKV